MRTAPPPKAGLLLVLFAILLLGGTYVLIGSTLPHRPHLDCVSEEDSDQGFLDWVSQFGEEEFQNVRRRGRRSSHKSARGGLSGENSGRRLLDGVLVFGVDDPVNVSAAQTASRVRDSLVCNKAQDAMQTKWFGEYLALGNWGPAACADPFPFAHLVELKKSLGDGPLTLLSIGTSKGFDVVKWMDFFAPASNINARSWSHYLQNRHMKAFYEFNMCGACGDCYMDPYTVHDIDFRDDPFLFLLPFDQGYGLPSSDTLRVLAIEAPTSDYLFLERLKNWSKHQALEVYNIAVSDGLNEYPVDKNVPPAFVDGLNRQLKWDKPLRYLTLDQILSELSVPHAHILKINAAGNEPWIIQGASRSLKKGKFSLIEFKYLDSPAWRESKLKGIVKFLSGFGYDCYMSTYISTYVRLTNCFHPIYEIFRESNILCANRKISALNEYFLSKCAHI